MAEKNPIRRTVQHENETINTATTNEEDEHSLVQDSVVEQDILQDDEEFKIEIGPIDEDCLSINVSFTFH